jgi:hypothetical protein
MSALTCPSCGGALTPPDLPGQQILRCSVCMRGCDVGALAQASPGGAPGRVPPALIITAGVGLLMVIGAVAFLATRDSDAAPKSAPSSAPAASTVSSTAPSQTPAPDLEISPVTLTWKGKLTASSGSAPAVGSPCTLTTTVRSRPTGMPSYDRLTLECRGDMLYDSSVPLSGAASYTFGLDEEPQAGVVGVFRYLLKSQDVGARTGSRAQITVDTRKHDVTAFRDAVPAFHVQATVDELTAERRGRPITAASVPPFGDVVSRKARVTTKSGAVPFAASSCEMLISPGYNQTYTCRVVLTCDGRIAYGAGTEGFDKCTLSGGQPVSFADVKPTPVDGDPELTCDLGAGTCTLGDTTKSGATYSVTFALAAP